MKKTWTKVIAGMIAILISAGSTGLYAHANKDNNKDDKKATEASAEQVQEETSPGYSQDAKRAKRETVYVMTDAKGNRTDTIVSDWLQNPEKLTDLPDVSTLTDIENIKTDEKYSANGDSLTWNTQGGDIYYKGHSDADLPVEISVSYKLDGKDIEPDDLIGKSGRVTIRYDYKNLSGKEVDIDGKRKRYTRRL